MDFDREKKKLEAQHEAAKARLEKEDVKRKALKRLLLTTSARLEDRAEKWHDVQADCRVARDIWYPD